MLPIHSFVCLLTFSLSLPVAISLFPQMSEVQYGIDLAASAAALRPDGPASSCRKHKLNDLKCTIHLQSPSSNPALVPRISSDQLTIQGLWGSKARWNFYFFFFQIEVSRLEPEIAVATNCKSVTYNKGLWLLFVVRKRRKGDRVKLQWETMFDNRMSVAARYFILWIPAKM